MGAIEAGSALGAREWWGRAACAGVDVGLFFRDAQASRVQALAICVVCPVIEECRTVGMSEVHGVWGGLLPHERARVDAERRAVRRRWSSEVSTRDASLSALDDAVRAAALSESVVAQAVATARAAGHSWEVVGRAFGLSRQAAHKRWASSTRVDGGRDSG
ncbi:WhiB family transcriptional regulator [Paraoerskovia marina]|uniref:WhiB family transcriptional regulator n=1 Tax=Paraoerskovia marina TaxID=545619 RepID=UPI0005B965FB|nr:WhiB family transcriptional regulator [Paraoerskovia marina]